MAKYQTHNNHYQMSCSMTKISVIFTPVNNLPNAVTKFRFCKIAQKAGIDVKN